MGHREMVEQRLSMKITLFYFTENKLNIIYLIVRYLTNRPKLSEWFWYSASLSGIL